MTHIGVRKSRHLTPEKKTKAIRLYFEEKLTLSQIAQRFGLSTGVIGHIIQEFKYANGIPAIKGRKAK